MKFKFLLFIYLFLTTILVNAQKDFRPGYLVNVNGDTLRGEIDYRGDILMGQVCRFRLNNNDKEVVYSPYEINEFKFNQSKYFVSKDVKGQKIFLEFLIKGKINIYVHKDPKGEHFFIEKSGLGLSELPYDEGIIYVNNRPMEIKSTAFLGLLNIYMKDAPEFQSRIANMEKPEQGNLIDLAKDYHNRVCKDEKCIIFEKTVPFLKVNIEFVAGVNNIKDGAMDTYFYYIQDANIKNQADFQAGILVDFWMPRVNEKLYLSTGILYSTFNSNNAPKKYYKIPVQIEYVYPKGILRPTLGYGINVYKPFNYSVSIMPGLNIQISKSLYLDINYYADFLPNYKLPLIPDRLYSHGFLSGLKIIL